MNRIFIVIILSAFFGSSSAQQLFLNTNFKDALKKGTRSLEGNPGKNYWQNKADYDLKISFDPATNLLSGEASILYYNNSPDTLKKIILRLYPDLYKKGVSRLSRIAEKDLGEGLVLDALQVGDEQLPVDGRSKKLVHSNTICTLVPTAFVQPHSQVRLTVSWHYYLNTGSQVRTGRVDSGSYFIAYFFPRIAVYDDMEGWDDWSYNGAQEFYNDFGDFKLSIKVPSNYVVWATGDRVAADQNFSQAILQKIDKANRSDEVMAVIDSMDYVKQQIFRSGQEGVWQFKATSISDIAIAISNHYYWYASSVVIDSVKGSRTLASAVFNKAHADYFDVANQARQSVHLMSHRYPKWPFPFPYITVFDGTDQMEYPMMVNDNPTDTHKDAVQLTSHEIFHSYFPFYMGINETQYAWMDEGWATIGESVISPIMGEPEDEGIFSKTRYERISGTTKDVPLITNTKLYQDAAYLSNSYGKGGLCYYVLQDMLGDEYFFKGLHRYMKDWHGKHPVPYDFFYSMDAESGMKLNWFWKKWFFEHVYPDLGIQAVSQYKNKINLRIVNNGGLPLPVYLKFNFADGSSQTIHATAAIWMHSNLEWKYTLKIKQPVLSVVLGNELVPDKYNHNNNWPLK